MCIVLRKNNMNIAAQGTYLCALLNSGKINQLWVIFFILLIDFLLKKLCVFHILVSGQARSDDCTERKQIAISSVKKGLTMFKKTFRQYKHLPKQITAPKIFTRTRTFCRRSERVGTEKEIKLFLSDNVKHLVWNYREQ